MELGTLAAAGISMIPSAVQGIQGLRQGNMAKKLKKSDYIPPGLREAEAMSRAEANATTMPGQEQIQEDIDRTTSNTVAATRNTSNDSTTVMDKLQEADARSKAAAGDIGKAAADFRFQNQRALEGTLKQKAQYEQANQDRYDAAKSSLKGASQQNIFNAFSNAASATIMGSNTADGGGAVPGSDGRYNPYHISPTDTPEMREAKMKAWQDMMRLRIPNYGQLAVPR